MRLPNAERAFIDLRKLADYSLNAAHEVGKHKAFVFAATLGLGVDDAEYLRDVLLDVARTQDAELGKLNEYGQRYTIDFELETSYGKATVKSGWIIYPDEDFPRLTSRYVLKRKRS